MPGPSNQHLFDCGPGQITVCVLMLLATRNSDTSKFVRCVVLLALLLSPAYLVEFLFWPWQLVWPDTSCHFRRGNIIQVGVGGTVVYCGVRFCYILVCLVIIIVIIRKMHLDIEVVQNVILSWQPALRGT